MTDPRIILLLVAAGLLSGIVGLEIAGGTGAADSSTIAARPRPEKTPTIPRLPSSPAPNTVTTSLARPLFSPIRRPPEVAQSGSGESELKDKRLAGIVVEPNRRLAIFAVTGAKPLTVREGDDVGGWRVETITAREVSVRGPGGTQTLQPKLDFNAVPPPRKQPAEPVPQAPARPFQGSATRPQNTGAVQPNFNTGTARHNRE